MGDDKIFESLVFGAEVTAVTVADVQGAEDNVFTTTVATSGSLPEHMLVNQHTLTCSVLLCVYSLCCQIRSAMIRSKGVFSVFITDLIKLMFILIDNHERTSVSHDVQQSGQTAGTVSC